MKLYIVYYHAEEDADVGIIGLTDSPSLLINEIVELLNNFDTEFSKLNDLVKVLVAEDIIDRKITRYGRFDFYIEQANVYLLKELAKDKNTKFVTTSNYDLGTNLDIVVKEVLEGEERETENEGNFDVIVEVKATEEAIKKAKEMFPDLTGGYGFDEVILTEDMIRLK